MNAYELADELENIEPYAMGDELALSNSANMLRQQADRIAELEKLVHQRFDDGKRLGVIETENRFNRSPQTKPLSDEEIYKLEAQYLKVKVSDDGNGYVDTEILGTFEFAKAIQEKLLWK